MKNPIHTPNIKIPSISLDLIDVLGWCKWYQRNNNFRRDPAERFIIGMYQLLQGFSYSGTEASHEGFISTALNFLMCSEDLGIPVEQHLSRDVFKGDSKSVTDRDFLMAQAKFAQMINYGYIMKKSNSVTRRSRFDKNVAAIAMATCINYCVHKVPTSKIRKGMEEAVDILVGVI
jgi:hypothetical protein